MPSDFITLTCPQCNAKLQITDDIDRFACRFCGTEHIVRRSGGIVALTAVTEKLDKIDQSIARVGTGVIQVDSNTRKTAAELAMLRIRNEVKTARAELEQLLNVPMEPMPIAPSNTEHEIWRAIAVGGLCLSVFIFFSTSNLLCCMGVVVFPLMGIFQARRVRNYNLSVERYEVEARNKQRLQNIEKKREQIAALMNEYRKHESVVKE